jgi:hypothetical protein
MRRRLEVEPKFHNRDAMAAKIQEHKGEVVIYRTEDGKTVLEVKLDRQNVWLSQRQVAQLFGTEVPAINKHIKNILKTGELQPETTISKMEIVQPEGKRRVQRRVELYNLDRGSEFSIGQLFAGQIKN